MRTSTGDYLLPVDKPTGPTSHDVVAQARRALSTRRVGHTGTLDPFASGLLVLCVGNSTRLAEYLSGMDKTYEAVAMLGVTTDTLDREGEVRETSEAWRDLTPARIEEELQQFLGAIDQVPPQFSAKKVDGEAMYERARRGEHRALPPVRVILHELTLQAVTLPELRFSVRCSSGTYIRALARDLGAALGCGAHLRELRRTRVGPFPVDTAVPLDRLHESAVVEMARIAPSLALPHLERVEVDEVTSGRLRNGQRVRIRPPGDELPHLVSVLNGDDLLAIAELSDGVLRPRKVFPT